MSESTIIDFINTNFWVGCIGALAPEALRLYNLRTNAVFKWNPGYLLCTLPLVLTGGFIASLSEPTVVWSAFYSGLCAPVLITTAAKDAAKVEKELVTTRTEVQELELKASQTQKQKEVLQSEIERLERCILRLEDEKKAKLLEDTNAMPEPVTPTAPPPIQQHTAPLLMPPTVDSSQSTRASKTVFKFPILLGIILAVFILRLFFLVGFHISVFIQVFVIVLSTTLLIYLLKKNRLFQEYLKGL